MSVSTALAQYPGSDYPGGYPGGSDPYPGGYPGGGYPGDGSGGTYPGGGGYPGGSGYPGGDPGTAGSGGASGSGSSGGGSSSGSGGSGYPGSGWEAVPCNADGSTPVTPPSLDGDGLLYMTGTEKTTAQVNYPEALKALARTDPGYCAGIPFDETVSPFNGAVVSAFSEPGLGIGLYSSSAEASANNDCAHGDTYWDGSASQTITGGVNTHIVGHLHVYYKWIWQGYGPPTLSPPDHIDLLVHTRLWADAYAAYGTSGKTAGLTATATATETRFNDTVSADAAASQNASSDKKHLARLDTPGVGPFSFDLDGSTDQNVVNTLPYGEFGPYPGSPNSSGYFQVTNGSTKATSNAFVQASTAVANVTLKADSTANTTNWDETHPRFFSGTNCTAHGSIDVDKSLIDRAELTVECGGDTATMSYPDLNPSHPIGTPNLAITFDSTHGGDGLPIKITYRVWDKTGDPPIEKVITANSYNEGEALSNHNAEFNSDMANYAADWISACNHSVSYSSNLHKDAILNLLPPLTALYIQSHGMGGAIGDCYATTTGPGDAVLFAFTDPLGASSIGDKCSSKTLAQPPYNFVFADGCSTSSDNALADAFLTPAGATTDRAFLGWHNIIWLDDAHVKWTRHFWQCLGHGETLQDAIHDADMDGLAHGVTNDGDPYQGDDGPPAIPIRYGDAGMKLHGVFGGTGLAWFR